MKIKCFGITSLIVYAQESKPLWRLSESLTHDSLNKIVQQKSTL